MKDYLKPENTGIPSGVCPICSINLYGTESRKVGDQTVVGIPLVMPCRVEGEIPEEGKALRKEMVSGIRQIIRYQCPFEVRGSVTKEEDNVFLKLTEGMKHD